MSDHDLPITSRLRAQFAEAGAQQCADLGLDPLTVHPWEDGWRTAHDPNTFEWWYFDVQTDDGANIVVTLSSRPHTHPSGPLAPQVLVIHRDPAGTSTKHLLSYEPGEWAAASGPDASCDVRVGPNWVRGNLVEYDLHVEAGATTVDLHIDRASPSWRPSSGYNYFTKDKSQYLAWVVPVPYGTAHGTLTTEGGARPFTGSAYHDHNWGNTPMGNGLHHWYWGRARVGDYSIIYVQMTTPGIAGMGRLHLPVWFLAKGDTVVTDDGLSLTLSTEDVVDGPDGHTYPTRLVWRWRRDEANDADGDPAGYGTITLTVTDVTLIETLDMTGDMSPAKRRWTHLLGRRPLYYDFDAHAVLDVDYAGVTETVPGRTLFEKMMFR